VLTRKSGAKFEPEGNGAIETDEIVAGLRAVMLMAVHCMVHEMADRMKTEAGLRNP